MKKNIRSNKHDLLKLIGVLTMLTEHIGWVFFPQYLVFQKIGRLAMPIFASGLAFGYRKTSNRKKYFITLLIFGLISQIPYNLLWTTQKMNIILALTLSFLIVLSVDKRKYFMALILLSSSAIFPIEYQWYLPMIVLIFYQFREKKIITISLLFLVTFFYISKGAIFYQWYAMAGFALILFLPEIKTEFRLNKYFFYGFYPIHMLVLYLMSQWI